MKRPHDPRAGEFWVAKIWKSDDSIKERKHQYLFLIVATFTSERKRLFVGMKCDWKSRKPFIEDWNVYYFDDVNYVDHGDRLCNFRLIEKAGFSGKKFLQ